MQKQIALVMRQRFVGEAIADRLRVQNNCVPHVIFDFAYALGYCRDFRPDLVLIEISDATADSFEQALALSKAFEGRFPQCKRMLFISQSDRKALLEQAVRAKQNNRIDGFVTADAGIEYVIASIQATA